jgi:hydroxymethylglutaryl-CoA lyase
VGWPKKVEIIDVTPRDGLQDAHGDLSTAEKVELIRGLYDAGIRRMESTSFVSPKWIPKLQDAEAVMAQVQDLPGMIGLVPNRKGFERAQAAGMSSVTFVVSASERHQESNLAMSLEESIAQFREIVALRRDAGLQLRLAVSCSFGSPFPDEEVSPQRVANICKVFCGLGASEVGLADTVGIATPDVIDKVIREVQHTVRDVPIAIHLHDRYGLGQGNVTAALLCGVSRFETALGGLGGCPFAPDAPGNLNTERLVEWLHAMGISTGIDLQRLAEVREKVLAQLQASSVH